MAGIRTGARTRTRTAAVTVPVGAALATLLGVGVLCPTVVDPGVSPATFTLVIAVGGSLTVTALGVAAARTRRRVRLSWIALAAMVGVWSLEMIGAFQGWEHDVVWIWLRGGAVVAGTVGMLVTPGVHRSPREWGLVLLDGWLVGGSVFVIGWVALGHTGSLLTGTVDHTVLVWIGVDLLFASTVAGLAMRTDRSTRTPAVLMVLVALLTVTGDTTWALTALPHFPAVQWLIMIGALAGASTDPRLDLWLARRAEPTTPRLLRWSQVAVVPGLTAALTAPGDPVVLTVATSVIVAMAAEIAVVSRQNHQLWRALHAQADRLDQVLRDSRDAIVLVDADGVVEFANDAVADVLGWAPPDLLGRRTAEIVHADDLAAAGARLGRLDRPDAGGGAVTSVRVTGRFRRQAGTWCYLEATVSRRTGGTPGFAVLARDVSDQLVLESQLRRLAATDTLTGLSNRHAFLTLLTERLAVGEAAVLFVDLDGFKAVNDLLGHATGDRLLREVAEVLRAELGPDDVAARLGGDEFAVLTAPATGTPVDALAERLARQLAERLSRLPSDAAGRTAASIGVAVGQGGSAEALLGDADLAMYEAKAAGGGRHVRFEAGMRRRITETARMRAALERACADDALRLDVQPIVAMESGTWAGFEALIRWQDGDVRRYPESFLPLAEETGLIVDIGTWALRTALVWLASWPDTAAGISVNVAARQVAVPGFGDLVVAALEAAGVAPHRLTLEVTEQTAVEDLQRASAVLQPLRTLGVHVSLDDFGTGFSSLGYLAQLPVDELKIDRRFVSGLGLRAEDDALVRAVTGLAADLGLRVVAEGVETAEQVRRLLDRGCPLGQGHHFQRPVPTHSPVIMQSALIMQ